VLKLRLAPLADTRLQAMEDDPASAAARQAEANFETLQQFSRQFESLLPSSSSAAATPKWEDIDQTWYEEVSWKSVADKTWDDMSTCTAESPAHVVERQFVGADVIESILATLENTASASSAAAASAPRLQPTAKWAPQQRGQQAPQPTPQAEQGATHAEQVSASSGDQQQTQEHQRLAEQWRSRPGHPSGGRYGNRGGKNKEWYSAQYKRYP
jgi:hypothetical protein